MNLIQRIWNWCRRFRHRRGYGVHSPSDFYLVTFVIYERLPYYAFRPLKERRFEEGRPHYRRKVNELLFRLVNHLAPKTLLEVGTGDGSSIAYMQEARPSMSAETVDAGSVEEAMKWLDARMAELGSVDFLHIAHTPYYKEVFDKVLPCMKDNSCMVIGNLYENDAKQKWWKEVIQSERVRITFDLYDVGIVFFHPKRSKQNYIINFL